MVKTLRSRAPTLIASGVCLALVSLMALQLGDFFTVESSAAFGIGATSPAGERALKPVERLTGPNSPTMLTRVDTERGAFTVEGHWSLPDERAVFVQRRLSGRRWLCGADVKYCYPIVSGAEH